MGTRAFGGILVAVWIAVAGASAQQIAGPAGHLYDKALAEIASGRLEAARGLLEQALKKAKGSDAVTISGTLAQVWSAMGKLDQAKAFLTVQAKKAPHAGYQVELARLILRTNPSGAGEAAEILQEALAMNPKDVEGWIEYGRALGRARRYDEAVKALGKVTLTLAPRNLRAQYALAEVWMMQSNFRTARETLQAALHIDPEAAETYVWLGHAYFRDFSHAGRAGESYEHYQNAYKIDRSRTMYLAHIIFNVITGDNYPVAKGWAARVEGSPNDSVALWYRGLVREQEGDVATAVDLQQRAVAANPTNVYAHFSLAHLYSGRPTPGFGPVRGPRTEGWRFGPHRDLRRAAGEIAVIKLMDPTFPYLSTIESSVTEGLAAEFPGQSAPTQEAVQRYQKLLGYLEHLQMVR